ncbi:tigger transposable element-derived protein 1-like isoform X2 [Chrysemys picta bellii]|uniref:tigger transposable element-derived protein 1-like isoform X2 n=1 Tax=Chrysemys picta bellii TaxID=8478 RepID=UPI0032B2457E
MLVLTFQRSRGRNATPANKFIRAQRHSVPPISITQGAQLLFRRHFYVVDLCTSKIFLKFSVSLPIIMAEKRKSGASGVSSSKKRRRSLSTKLEMIQRSERGETPTEISRALHIPRSTVSTILQNKERIQERVKDSAPMQSTVTTKQNVGLNGQVEKLLFIWLEDQTQRCAPVSSGRIQEKARSLYDDLKKQHGESSNAEPFNANRGWFMRFKARANLHNIKVSDEAASADEEAARVFPEALAKIIEKGGYCAQQVFNVAETRLFWKKIPLRTDMAEEEESMPGYKAAKDRITLLLGANAAGDFKLKPLLVYHSENPKAFHGYSTAFLPVIWKSHPNVWVNKNIFEDWFNYHFVPSVRDYCSKNNLAFKALLILNNSPGHPPSLDDMHPDIQVVFLPPNTTSLLQPVDQGVIAYFKAHYLRSTFAQAIRETEKQGGPTLKEFCKSFNIYHAVKNIGEAWNEVKQPNLNGVWKKLCPDFVSDFQGFTDTVEVTNTVVEMGKELNLDIAPGDVDELLASHSEELTNEDLIEWEQQKVAEEEEDAPTVEETPPHKVLTIKVLAEAFQHLEAAMSTFEVHDPSVERSASVNRDLYNTYSCYREIYKEKKRASVQTPSDTSLSPSNSPPNTPESPIQIDPPVSSDESVPSPSSSLQLVS